MIAQVVAGCEGVVQILFYQFFRRQRRGADNYLDIVLSKKILGHCSHSAGNNHIGTQVMKPFWQHTGFMGRWDNRLFIFDLVIFNFN